MVLIPSLSKAEDHARARAVLANASPFPVRAARRFFGDRAVSDANGPFH